MNIDELLKSHSDKVLESEEFIIHEKNKIKDVNITNIAILNHLDKFIVLIDKVETSLNQKTQKQMTDVNKINLFMAENLELLKTISKNLL